MFIRRLAGMALLMACMGAYWIHFEDRFAELEAETALRDAAGVLSKNERTRLQALRTALREDFGISARLVVRNPDEASGIPVLSENILYMAVTPAKGEVNVVLPALVRQVLAAELGPEPENLLVERLSLCVGKTHSRSAGHCLETALVDTLAALGTPPARGDSVTGTLPTTVRSPLNSTLPTGNLESAVREFFPVGPAVPDAASTTVPATDSSVARATP